MSTSPRRKVIEAIREQITSGRYTAGSRLPTELELADELAVARGTVRSALRELAETGVVELRRKIGGIRGAVHAGTPLHVRASARRAGTGRLRR